ncbi:LysM peptidoglycan-binding domain-containing protein [Marinilabiliaceae bacterium ANBcel2]|nr:LysM peptidoglycan-binding domain-containing protein [Marinilabiliaceae bacterium ANBcel2]
MKILKIDCFLFLLFTTLLFFQGSINAQHDNDRDLQRIVLDGKEYYLHVIERGEGLYRISVDYGVTMQEILDANDDISESLKVGQILRIPVISGRNETNQERDSTGDFLYHTVEKGQTAFYISRKYDVPLEIIYEYNSNTREGLVEGAVLRFPVDKVGGLDNDSTEAADSSGEKGESYIYHTVQPRETLYALSREYDTEVEDIIALNPALRSGVLSVGSEIRIPVSDEQKREAELRRASAESSQESKESQKSASSSQFIESGDYLYHNIESGQTLYSISRRYQVSVEDIKEANPGVSEDDLRVGYRLRVPRPDLFSEEAVSQRDESRLFITHEVRRRETLFGISREYHVDIEVIKEVNPDVDFADLQTGAVLHIPTDAWFANRTALALSETEPEDEPLFDDFVVEPEHKECEEQKYIGYERPVRVALLLPFAAKSTNEYLTNENDTLEFSQSVRSAASRSRIFTEFYSGVLLALDTLKNQGINVDLSVYDIYGGRSSIQRALRDPSLKKSDLIIGPAESRDLKPVSEFSKEHSIPLIYPLSNTNNEIGNNPYLYHINTPDSLVYDIMANEIVKQAAGHNILVILPSSQDKDAVNFVDKLKQKVSHNTLDGDSINFREYSPGSNDLVEIQALIKKDEINYIVVPSKETADVARIIPVLSGVKERTGADIRLFGMSDWLRYETVEPAHIHKLNGTIFTSYALDYDCDYTNKFINKYREWYYTEPHAISPYFQFSSTSSGYSRYGISGYDVAGYFIQALVKYGDNLDICINECNLDLVQFNFKFQRVSNWSGFYNRGIHMLRFKPDLTTQRVIMAGN